MNRSTRASLLITALAIAAIAAMTGSAFARSPVSDLARTGKARSTSSNWSGYAAKNSTFSDAKGSWVVPAANCTQMKGQQVSIASPWVGLDGYTSGTVEQTGTDTDCIGKSPYYQAWYEFYPQQLVTFGGAVHAGDAMNAEVSHSGSTTTVTLQDVTQGWTNSASSTLSFALSSAEWIMEAPSSKLTDFGSVSFTNAGATNGTTTNGAISAFDHDAITLVSKNGRTARAAPSALSGGGRSFSVAFQSP
ncbi:MAG: hypothetical protein QOE08_1260 [Thermoleophilaceae bacterium]|nr:hypothetical protein [Thermoleophilaceae bacterium]